MKAWSIFIITLLGLLVSLHGLIVPQQRIHKPRHEKGYACRDIQLSNNHQYKGVNHHQSPLFMSSDDGLSPQNQKPGKKLVVVLRKFFYNFFTYPGKVALKFSKLSKRAKSIVLMQFLALTMVFGSVGKTVYAKYYQNGPHAPPIEVPYSNFLNLVETSGKKGINSGVIVDNVRISPDRISYRLTKEATKENKQQQIVAFTRKVAASPELIQHLQGNSIPFTAAQQPRTTNNLAMVARTAVLGFYMLILWRMYKAFGNQSGNSDVPGKLASPLGNTAMASFNDIQGIDDAKMEVMELVDTLRFPDKYAVLGARAPTGLLLEGPPGTGKTMLARATAATAGVPLLYCSGSDFVEMFVGRGAARVRKLFERASRLAPCIIFVDELDALGKARDSGNAFVNSRGNDEAEQTLNQLLACMDGLDSTRRICVLAATNRKEVLDPALIRPGRFDRIVKLSLPDAQGRENILRVHAKKLPGFKEGSGVDEKRINSLGVGDEVDLSAVAAVTSGFSGAELEFLVNEAAIRAVRRVSSAIRVGNEKVIPHVQAEDFESSLQNFYSTRKPKSNNVNEMWKSVWGQ